MVSWVSAKKQMERFVHHKRKALVIAKQFPWLVGKALEPR